MQRRGASGRDESSFNIADGSAAFLPLILRTILRGLATWLYLASKPLWLHVVLWWPLWLVLVLAGLHITKAWLIGAEYRRKAGKQQFRE